MRSKMVDASPEAQKGKEYSDEEEAASSYDKEVLGIDGKNFFNSKINFYHKHFNKGPKPKQNIWKIVKLILVGHKKVKKVTLPKWGFKLFKAFR